jgi:pimeloyl-ACP methyl ester carboxylesterase
MQTGIQWFNERNNMNRFRQITNLAINLSRPGILIVFFVLTLGFASANPLAAQTKPLVQPKPCANAAVFPDARCGTLTVYENRAKKSGRQIGLNIAVLPALNKDHAPDPLFILAGGPGGDIIGEYMGGPPDAFVTGIRAKRDIVLVDQRGTGGSHALPCDLFPASGGVQQYFGDFAPLEIVRACRTELSKDADLTQYSTPIAMDDLDDVRAALGYDQINLHGGSYGTRAALIYMRQHPTHVRSVFLEGVVPPGAKHPLPRARGTQHALDRLIDDCAAGKVCHAAYPDVRADLNKILADLEKQPAKIQAFNPETKKMETMELTRDGLAARLDISLYSPVTARVMPFLFNQGAKGNLSPLASFVAQNIFGIDTLIARGMWLSVICAEDVQWITDADVVKETAGTFMGGLRANQARAACKEWPLAKIGADYLKPVDSAIPVLMVSGDADPATPVWLAVETAKHLPNSRHIIVNFGAHGVPGPCMDHLIENFFDAGSAKSLDASCLDAVRRPEFFTQSSAAANPFSDIPASATPSAIWRGAINAGGSKLRLVLRVYTAADGKLSAALDSVDQPGANNLRVDAISIEKNHLHFEMKGINAVYDGDISEGGSDIHGTFTQNSGGLPLDFHRDDTNASSGKL